MKLAAALVTVYLVWGSTYLAIAVANRTLPPLLMLSAVCIRVLGQKVVGSRQKAVLPVLGLRSIQAWGPRVSGMVCAAIALASAGYFLTAQGPTTASNIAQNEARWKATRAALASMDPASTVLVISIDWDGPFRVAGYLLPQFHSYAAGKGPDEKTLGWLYSAYGGQSTYALPHPPPASYLPLPPGTRTIISLDAEMAESLSEQWSAQSSPQPGPRSPPPSLPR